MNSERNTLKGFLFFLLRLISVALVVSSLYLAYDLYTDYKAEKVADEVVPAFNELLQQFYDSLK